MNTREKLLGLKLKQEVVQIEGITVVVKEMLAGEASVYENSLYMMVNNKPIVQTKDAEIKLIIYSCYDSEDNKLFKIEDIEQARQLPATVVDKLYTVAKRINSVNKEQAIKN